MYEFAAEVSGEGKGKIRIKESLSFVKGRERFWCHERLGHSAKYQKPTAPNKKQPSTKGAVLVTRRMHQSTEKGVATHSAEGAIHLLKSGRGTIPGRQKGTNEDKLPERMSREEPDFATDSEGKGSSYC